jgi:hypothetical protein
MNKNGRRPPRLQVGTNHNDFPIITPSKEAPAADNEPKIKTEITPTQQTFRSAKSLRPHEGDNNLKRCRDRHQIANIDQQGLKTCQGIL